MSYLPFENKIPRCLVCDRVLDGEAEVANSSICSDCLSSSRHGERESVRDRQRRIEEDLA